MADTCVKCGNPLAENAIECDICGADVLGPDATFLTRHPLLRRVQELGIAMLTLILGLALGAAIIIAIQLNHAPASAKPVIEGGPLITTTPEFVPAIVATSALTSPQTPVPANATPNPQFAARDLLVQATKNMDALHSYQVNGSFNMAGQPYVVSATVAPPDKASMTMNTAGVPGPRSSLIYYNSNTYISTDGGASWYVDNITGPAVSVALIRFWSDFNPQAITSPTAIRLAGHEQIGAVSTTHLQTDFATIGSAHRFFGILTAAGDSGSVDLWISDSDATIQRITADVRDGKDEYKLDLTFSNFNGPVTITPPK